MSELDKIVAGLNGGTMEFGTHENHQVVSQTGTTRFDPTLTQNSSAADEFAAYGQRVDALFADRPSYQAVKKENPAHRMMLWLALQGHNAIETARITGYTPEHVRTIRKQPWFRESFCRLSTEMGKDVVQTFLEGEVLPALQRTVELATTSVSDAVRATCNRDILDRFLGKATVKVEAKTTGSVDHFMHDADKLLEESRRLDEQLAANGLKLNLAGRS